MKITQHYPIRGMTCSNCVAHVEKALKNLPGISNIEVHLERNEALIEYDSTLISYEIMASAIQDAGYKMDQPND